MKTTMSSSTKWIRLATSCSGFLFTMLVTGQLIAQPVLNPANGHSYVVVNQYLLWPDARVAAAAAAPLGFKSYLATITSEAEYEFVTNNVPGFQFTWLGGYQPNPNVPPDQGWAWVTGEPWVYENWTTGEPNDFYGPGSEYYLMFWFENRFNDQFPLARNRYIVEFEPLTITIGGCDTGVLDVLLPGPTSISELIAGCAAGAANHGKFVSCVAGLMNQLKAAGIITGAQQGAIVSCAAKAAIP